MEDGSKKVTLSFALAKLSQSSLANFVSRLKHSSLAKLGTKADAFTSYIGKLSFPLKVAIRENVGNSCDHRGLLINTSCLMATL